jgi:3-dehydroquinate dehydratase/shikimate dehydrogenase
MDIKSQVCVPVCAESVREMAAALQRSTDLCDLVELRLDCLEPSELKNVASVSEVLAQAKRPSIVTYRPAEQGGKRQLDAKSRLLFWIFNRPEADFFDIEFDIATTPALFDRGRQLDWSRVICSYHNFVGVPVNLLEIYDRISVSPARILKVAVQADDATDCIPLFQLMERAAKNRRATIAIAMGSAGVATRILGPSRGGFLVYASADKQSAIAPGQISVKDLREVYRIDKLNPRTAITGLMGHPVVHSISSRIHNAAFHDSDENAVYIPFDVKDAGAFLRRMVHPTTREVDWNMLGLSVTAPHKRAVIAHLDSVDSESQAIGAVNTIVAEKGKLRGYNTDWRGFIKPLEEKLGDLSDVRCAVIGTGGAAAAAIFALSSRLAAVTVFARDATKAEELHERFDVEWERIDEAHFGAFDAVINATPLGTSGSNEQSTPALASQLAGARLAYDLVYNPTDTLFLREARKAGCDTLNGLPMLIAQAAEQFKLWTGKDAPLEVMRDAAKKAFKEMPWLEVL